MSASEATSIPAITRADIAAECAPLPLPGSGKTHARWDRLVAVGHRDLALAKLVELVEPHHDAVAILAELGGPVPRDGQVWGVWAAEPPFAVLRATSSGNGWRLTGTKAFCSGGTLVTHALVTRDRRRSPALRSGGRRRRGGS